MLSSALSKHGGEKERAFPSTPVVIVTGVPLPTSPRSAGLEGRPCPKQSGMGRDPLLVTGNAGKLPGFGVWGLGLGCLVGTTSGERFPRGAHGAASLVLSIRRPKACKKSKTKQNKIHIFLGKEPGMTGREGRGVGAAAAAPPLHHVGGSEPLSLPPSGRGVSPSPLSAAGVGAEAQPGGREPPSAARPRVHLRRRGAQGWGCIEARPRDASRQENLRSPALPAQPHRPVALPAHQPSNDETGKNESSELVPSSLLPSLPLPPSQELRFPLAQTSHSSFPAIRPQPETEPRVN